jgi:hypothetical protein
MQSAVNVGASLDKKLYNVDMAFESCINQSSRIQAPILITIDKRTVIQ